VTAKAKLDRLLLEGLASPPEEWTPTVRQAMAAEAVAILRSKSKAVYELRREIDAGLADADAGRVREGEAVFDELLEKPDA
jgi:predicted transcriptional regulator